jgi:Ferric reductase like transmembrane component
MSSQTWWYVTRASGLVSWALVSAAVIWGLAVSTRVMAGRPTPAWLLDLHRFLGGLALTFTGIHLAALVADGYTDFGVADLVVPFRSTWRPVAVAWGVVALYLLLAIELTSLAQRKLPRWLWRRVHASSFVLFVLATVHGFAAGSEAGNPAMRWFALASMTVVLFLLLYRSLVPRNAAAAAARARAGGAARGATAAGERRPRQHPPAAGAQARVGRPEGAGARPRARARPVAGRPQGSSAPGDRTLVRTVAPTDVLPLPRHDRGRGGPSQ